MAQCPSCKSTVEEDFGIVNCSSCGAMLIVDFDGQVRMHGEENVAPPSDEPQLPPVSAPNHLEQPTTESFQEENGLPSDSFYRSMPEPEQEMNWSEGQGEPSPQENFEDMSLGESLVESFNESPTETPEFSMESDSEEVAAYPQDPPPVEEVPFAEGTSFGMESTDTPIEVPLTQDDSHQIPEGPPSDPSDISDISEFGNSEMSQGKEGSLRFNIFITGIDTADIRESIKEALTDKRFIWDIEAIMKTIDHGQLKIEELSSVKSSIVVQRIKNLPVQIRWEQYAIHQS